MHILRCAGGPGQTAEVPRSCAQGGPLGVGWVERLVLQIVLLHSEYHFQKNCLGPNCNQIDGQNATNRPLKMSHLINQGMHPPMEQVMQKVEKRHISCGALRYKQSRVPSLASWFKSVCLLLRGEPAPGEFCFYSASQSAREGKARSLPPSLPRPACVLAPPAPHAPPPPILSTSLPFPPCRGGIKSKAGSGSPPSSPKIPPKELQSRANPEVEPGEERDQ